MRRAPGLVRAHRDCGQGVMGRALAPRGIDTGVRGASDGLAARRGTGCTAFVDCRNAVIPW